MRELDSNLSPGPQGTLEALDDFWWGLWGREEPESYNIDRWVGYLHALPPPPEPEPMSADLLARAMAG